VLLAAACSGAPHDRREVSSEDCVVCHRAEFLSAAEPPHEGELPQSCGHCHESEAWRPARNFDHDFFPLRAQHAGLSCTTCHTAGFVDDASPLCVSCHRDDYDASAYSGHDQFPTTCQDCHSLEGWTPAYGGLHPEEKFRIGSGPHAKYECLECHDPELGPNGAGNADCVGCHEGKHTRAKMDEKHHEVRDYPAGDAPQNFCLECHPDGRKE
jgi:hypothetical protein